MSHVFSVVMLDGDSADNVRALRKAAQDGDFFGRFFIASPDFELANFTVDELVNSVLTLAFLNGGDTITAEEILPLVRGVKSVKEFFAALETINLTGVAKGADWGAKLMEHAIGYPELPQGHEHAGKFRPVIEAARIMISAQDAGYVRSLERFVVDPGTGELREK